MALTLWPHLDTLDSASAGTVPDPDQRLPYTRRVTKAIIEELRHVLESGPPLRLAVLFGSAAQGHLRADSDLDVGIVPQDRHLPLTRELTLQAHLERACRRHVDLVRLDRASTLLRWEAARHGVMILADPPREFSRFVEDAALAHADFLTAFCQAAERFRRGLLASPIRPGPTG
jgi:predicted nucleotidyltransferase